jgi:ATPase subunit of ABC transporter with duplicated ATPase domains
VDWLFHSSLAKEIMLILENISYKHQELLFDNINLSVTAHNKIALIGNNGSGKSTLLKIIAGQLVPSGGQFRAESKPYYVPQVFGQYDHYTVAQALGIADKLYALHQILNGDVTEKNFAVLNEDWTIDERCREALAFWQLQDVDLTQKLETLSGGQKVKVFLAGILVHQPKLILLDEPSNHLDLGSRELVYDWVVSTSCALVVVSHDRKLLNLLNNVCELTKQGLKFYGGNYDFYKEQKEVEETTLHQDILHAEKTLRSARTKERETIERQQKLDARGKRKHEKEGVARIMMNTLRNNAEKSTANIKGIHTEKIGGISEELKTLRASLPQMDQMKFGFDEATLHKGKILLTADKINFGYDQQLLWKEPLSFVLKSGERVALKGANGSGKSTLIQLLLGKLEPQTGTLQRAEIRAVYIDQEYSLIQNDLTVYEQAQQFSTIALQEHEVKTRLYRFLFASEDWDKSCRNLSGGERLRLILCCLTISDQSPDLIILDEPTNNLDLQNIGILTEAIKQYRGTLIVVSHDEYFLDQVGIERTITLD